MEDEKTERKAINPYWVGGMFIAYCVRQGWLDQLGSGGKGTRWFPTEKGRKEMKEKFGIEL
ncbi:MAG: hypothetical protein LUP94_03830 [Candidatus Methanomethylicus sp.]|nr:hypothetical protein [Candidatus Methanomethylicus sp.]